MANFSIENLRSPRSPRRSSGSNFFYPESGVNSGASTPYVSAPSSPRGYYYYSAPPTPPRNRGEDSGEIAVPFSWEAKPGTPKAAESGFRFGGESESKAQPEQDGMKTSVDHLTAIGFHFSSAPVSPQREFDFMNGNVLHHQVNSISKLDEFEFSSARMSDADSVVSHADELFFQGQILPLKLPPRLQQKSSLSVSLQLQDHFSPKSGHNREFSPTRSPRGGAGGSRFVHQLHSPKIPKSGFARPPAAYGGYPKSPRSKSPSKLVKGGSQDENKSPSKRLHPQPTTPKSSIRKTLKELLHINTSKSSGGNRKQESVNLMGADSQRSSRSSSSSSSQRFSDSRSSSVSSTKSGRSSFSSKQVSPAPHDFMQSYNRSYHKPSNADELRRRTFLPYKQGLLGCLSCISAETFQEIQELRNQTR